MTCIIIGLFYIVHWNFNQRRTTKPLFIVLATLITLVSLFITFYCWIFQVLHETPFQVIKNNFISKQNLNYLLLETARIRYGYFKIRKICHISYNLSVFPLEIVLKRLTFLPFTQDFPFQIKRQFERIDLALLHKKCQTKIHYLVTEEQIILCKKKNNV